MIVGIDLGTSNSLISVFEDGSPKLIPNVFGKFMTPSVVGFDDTGEVLVGTPAKDRLVSHPDLTASQFKRSMGTDKKFELGTTRKMRKLFGAEELSALVLRDLKASAETYLKADVTEAVISVPAYFNEHQRQATMQAGALAGLKVRALINEPTAAALAYGLVDIDGAIKEDDSSFLVFDLGGGTFDVSVLEMFEGVLEVRASTGDAFLGGEDFTQALATYLIEKTGLNAENLSAKDKGTLFATAERIKHQLGLAHEFNSKVVLGDDEHEISLTRKNFDEIVTPLVQKLRRPLQRAVADAGIKLDELDRILLVGGATRMQIVKDMVARLFGRFPEFGINPDEVVALGASVQAALIGKDAALADVVMTDVAPFTLGIQTSNQVSSSGGRPVYDHDSFSPIIERNTVVPVSREQNYGTLADNQTVLEINVYQGEASHCKNNILLGKVSANIPKGKAGQESVDVRFTYDPSGLLEVDVTAVSTKRKYSLIIEGRNAKLDPSEIAAKLKALEALKVHPKDLQQNKALTARIERMYEMTLGENRQYIGSLSSRFQMVIDRQDKYEIAETTKEISGILDELESGFEL